jgi:hypothetical protein
MASVEAFTITVPHECKVPTIQTMAVVHATKKKQIDLPATNKSAIKDAE